MKVGEYLFSTAYQTINPPKHQDILSLHIKTQILIVLPLFHSPNNIVWLVYEE